MLLEAPNPKDPQDYEVAKMMMEEPEKFALKAQEWAVQYAGAAPTVLDMKKWKKEPPHNKNVDGNRYVTPKLLQELDP
jgi:ubiquitin-conjugating enzyme (huntingtin interacting protein 2)